VIAAGDGYQREVEACVRAILTRAAWPHAATLAYQSQGADGGDWLGPDLRAVLGEAARSGVRDVIVAPFGFLAEHVETLYDLDIEAAGWCRELGLTLHRVPALNTAPGLIEALAGVADRALG
jgi:ferrochelatase